MVLGWRKAFCTSISKDPNRDNPVFTEKHCNSDSDSNSRKFGFFSNPSTPRLQSQPVSSPTLRCRTRTSDSPKLHSQASSPRKMSTETPRLVFSSNSSSPKSPSTFSLLKSTLRLSTKLRTRCGICVEPAKGTAIFTGECSHVFHFHCIAAHFKTHQFLLCPVCNAAWKELPLFPMPELQSSDLKDVKTKSLRVYNDDEPLMSPTSGARFNPIPESNEDEEDDESDAPREFQGFYVNPTFWNSAKSNGHNRSDVDVGLSPEVALLAVGRGFETCVVKLRVKAPPAGSGARRPPIDLVTVLEVSGAMTGVKLETMKRAMRLVVSSLSESDRLSIVAFSTTSKRLLPLRRMTASGRRSARWIIDAVSSTGQGMCVSDAIKKAAKVLEDRRQKNSVAGIVLFSDGRNERNSSISSTRFSHGDIPVHTVSIGAYDNAPSDSSLAKGLTGLLSVVVQDLRLQLGFNSSSSPAQVTGVYSITGKPSLLGSDRVRLGDFLAEEDRELLVELKLTACSSGPHQILSVRPSFKDPSSGVIVSSKEQSLVVPRPQAVRSSSPSIKRLRNLHITVRAVAECRRLIEHNDLFGAHHLLSSARALLMKSGSGSSAEFLVSLEAEQAELHRRRRLSQNQKEGSKRKEKSEPSTPTSSWRAAERLAKVAIMRKSMNRVSDLHGFENAGF